MRTVQRPRLRLGPADRVTLARALLGVGVAVLVVRDWWAPVSPAVLAVPAAVALALDAVDGPVARRTGTASARGARFDMEVDAALLLVLSVYVAPRAGWWVLLIGLARYLLAAARRASPRLRGSVPARRWRKVVAATQGVVLVGAVTGAVPDGVVAGALGGALTLLAASFGSEAVQLWRRQRDRPRLDRAGLRTPATTLAVVVVWVALVLPDDRLSVAALARVPVEGLALVALALVVPARLRRPAAGFLGVLLSVLVLLAALDLGFRAVLDRPFDPAGDVVYLRAGTGVLQDSLGRPGAALVLVGLAVAVLALLVGLPWCVVRVADVAAGHRRGSGRTLVVLGAAWLLSAAAGLHVGTGLPVASAGAAGRAVDEAGQLRADLHDRAVFARAIAADPVRERPGLLSALRGKDVLLVFVESYGRVAVQGTTYSAGVDRVLDRGTATLRSAGFSARSAFLTSPTYGAASWLAHSTLQSGLWVDSQRRYDQLMGASRLTLTSAFREAGWRTVFDVPANTEDWPQGHAFYGFDQIYDARDVGYHGPRFSYATMPDQYTLAAFERAELDRPGPSGERPAGASAPSAGARPPVLAEIDLVSSHHPWTPLPRLVPWAAVGDGSVFDPMPAQGRSPTDVFRDPDAVRAVYGASIEYSLSALVSFVRHRPDPNLVLVVVGDHQPHHYVSGYGVGHDVPISVIAHDPAVLRRIAGWGWQDGLRPHPDAPVWRMDGFRDRFLAAFSDPAGVATRPAGTRVNAAGR